VRTVIVQQHAVDVVAKRIEQPVATAVCTVLASVEHIPVRAQVAFDGTLHLWPQRQLATAEEVTTLRAFTAVTDVRLRLHEAVTS
jgi:hypothetical protein